MGKYNFKFNKKMKTVTGIILALCLIAVVYSIVEIITADLLVDYVSNAFLIFINVTVAFFVFKYLYGSHYELTTDSIIIRTAVFKDKIDYNRIKKILFYATEDELFLELKEEENLFHINIDKNEISGFVKEIRDRIPEIPYEVSLKIESDPE